MTLTAGHVLSAPMGCIELIGVPRRYSSGVVGWVLGGSWAVPNGFIGRLPLDGGSKIVGFT